jgi:uncharacterized protein YjiS (DUF1127 family)
MPALSPHPSPNGPNGQIAAPGPVNLPAGRGDQRASSRASQARPDDSEATAMRQSRSLIALRLWMRYRSDRRVLSRLSNRTLRDIGLSRAGIGYAAKTGAAPVYAAASASR